jgi:hypothetical protein
VHGRVVVVVLLVVLVVVLVEVVVLVVEVVDVEVVVAVVMVVLEVDVVVGMPTPQDAAEHVGAVSLPSSISSVTRQVSDGSAQCENWITPMSQSVVASHRGALGSTHMHPAKKATP